MKKGWVVGCWGFLFPICAEVLTAGMFWDDLQLHATSNLDEVFQQDVSLYRWNVCVCVLCVCVIFPIPSTSFLFYSLEHAIMHAHRTQIVCFSDRSLPWKRSWIMSPCFKNTAQTTSLSCNCTRHLPLVFFFLACLHPADSLSQLLTNRT